MSLLRSSFQIGLVVVLLLECCLVVQARQFEWEDEDTIIVEATREEDQENLLLGRTGYQQFYTKLSTNAFSRRQGRAFQGFVQTCYSVLGDQGHCTTFRECFPMLYYTEGEHQGQIKHPVLADLLKSTSGPCVAAPFSFRDGRDDFVPFLESEEESAQSLYGGQTSSLADAKDLICCPSDRPSPIPPSSSSKPGNRPKGPTTTTERTSMRTSTTTTPAPDENPAFPIKSDEYNVKDAVAALISTVKDSMVFQPVRLPQYPATSRPVTRAPTTRPPATRAPATRATTRAPAIRVTTRAPVTNRPRITISTAKPLVRPQVGQHIEDDESDETGTGGFNVLIPQKPQTKNPVAIDMRVPIDFGPGEVGIIVDAMPDPEEVVVSEAPTTTRSTTTTTQRPKPSIKTPPPDVSAGIDYSKPKQTPPKATQRPTTTTRAPKTTTTTTTTEASLPAESSEEDYDGDAMAGIAVLVPAEIVTAKTTTTTSTTTTTTTPVPTTTTEATTESPVPTPERTTTSASSTAIPTTPKYTNNQQLVTKKPAPPEPTRVPCGRLNSTSDPPFPWVAAIKLGNRFICAGSIIDEYHIITAAHCLSTLSTVDIGRLRVYLGERILNSNEDGPTIIRKVQRAMRHKGFSVSTLRNDIALLKLSLPIPVGTKRVRPICLPLDSDRNLMDETSSEASIVGWAPNWNEIDHDFVHDNKYKVYMDDGCLEKYRNFMPHVQIEDSMLCANLDFHPKGLAQLSDVGSDGSPVIIKDKHGIYQQIGISSWRLGPSPVYPRVLTRIASFQSWLQKNRVRP